MKITFTQQKDFRGHWLAVFFFLTIHFSLSSQDARFAQFYANPLQLNPAMIGVVEGQYRFSLNYRELYSSLLGTKPFRTMSAGFDMRHRVMKGDFLGFGISALRDQVGISQFNRTRANLGASFMKQLGGGRYATNDQYLIAGAQLGFGQRGFDWGKLWFSQQFDPNAAIINFDADSGESFDRSRTNIYLDFNAGILWYALLDDRLSLYFGGAMHHLNTPKISFLEDDEERLYTRYVVHGGGELPLGNNLSLLPALAFMSQGPSMSTTAGANFRYTSREWREVAIRAGLWGHVANQLESGLELDALIFTAILETERWNIGLSYDVTTSVLAEVNNARGAFELSLIYVHPATSRKNKIICPNF